MKILLALLFSATSLVSQAQSLNTILDKIEVKMVAPGTISTGGFEYGTTVSPDGQWLSFTKGISGFNRNTILLSEKKNGQWQAPQIASFSGEWNDVNPYFSKDGKGLYFVSNRPSNDPGLKKRNWWYVERKGNNHWGKPKLVQGKVNGVHDMIYPTITSQGNAYFCTYDLPGGKGRLDLYQSKLVNGKYQPPVALKNLNTKYSDADPDMSPNGRFFAFTSTRPGGLGHYDLYICTIDKKGNIGKPIHLGAKINSRGMDSDPIFSPDGRKLYFSSNRITPRKKHPKKFTSYRALEQYLQSAENGLMNIYVADISPLLDYLNQE
ncbi:MAG TPA: hypothetical protein DCS93_39150 [Microscillaceae bacterium]|nr:hypothetical protein [Microscillaceae bacterium]